MTWFSKKKYFPSIYHKNYNENISLSSLSTNKVTLYSHIIWFLMKRGQCRHHICLNWITHNKKFGPEELILLYTANTTAEACAEWISLSFSSLQAPGALWSIQHKPPHTNHNVGAAWLEMTTFPLHCKIEKNKDDRKRTYLQVTHIWSYWSVESSPTRTYIGFTWVTSLDPVQ